MSPAGGAELGPAKTNLGALVELSSAMMITAWIDERLSTSRRASV